MNPLFSVVCSALNRASELVECGFTTAEALKRASEELERWSNDQPPQAVIPAVTFKFGADVGKRETVHLPNRKQA